MSQMNKKTITTTTSFRNLQASPEPMVTRLVSPSPVFSGSSVSSVTPMSQVSQVSAVPYAVNGASYGTLRYLVPVQQQQQQQSFVLMQQPMMQQPVMQQVVSPMYLQNMQQLSISNQNDYMYQDLSMTESTSRKSSSVFSHSTSPIKSPATSVEEEVELEVEEEEEEEEGDAVEVEEVEIVNVIQSKPPPVIEKISRREVRTELKEIPEPTKLDTRYFGELLADVYRKNCDIHSYISEHVSKIRGQKHQMDLGKDSMVDKEEVEALIPKGATELTKQQMRYLLQTRLTADKSMRLLLSTFNSLREELMHMSEDLRRLESEKDSLERDLSFKTDQARQYDSLLATVRENNRQLQLSVKESQAAHRSLESQIMSKQSSDSNRDFKLKEMEARMKAMENENKMLRQKLAGQGSSSTFQIKTDELSRQYNEQLSTLTREKDREIERLRTQITRIQTEVTTDRSSSEKSLQLKITELLTMLEQQKTTISKQEEEIRRLMQDRNSSSKNVTKTIITKRYRNQYPILGLLSDDYQVTSPVKEDKTIVIERSGQMIKQE
ncbi:protein POF1B isoform X2 [Astatotilapia calliptera]|uniref:POF1B actin binding protein n=2 Tax=Haplochromini TaxID=319058 RepID=A0A3P9C089_9CICH|nr:protein POF1B isoform X2 [Maylandia zebra]XP_026037579.1 protein POF1B isoform X2 [Astatotilapia calliptera]